MEGPPGAQERGQTEPLAAQGVSGPTQDCSGGRCSRGHPGTGLLGGGMKMAGVTSVPQPLGVQSWGFGWNPKNAEGEGGFPINVLGC